MLFSIFDKDKIYSPQKYEHLYTAEKSDLYYVSRLSYINKKHWKIKLAEA
jgi:hypothetical protein